MLRNIYYKPFISFYVHFVFVVRKFIVTPVQHNYYDVMATSKRFTAFMELLYFMKGRSGLRALRAFFHLNAI